MKVVLAIGIFFLFVSVAIAPLTQSTIQKRSNLQISNGNILYVGGTGEGNYSRIQDAIYNANKGDTVFVYDDSSPYNENIVISKSISLIGESKYSTVISGNYKYPVKIEADDVNICGFTIKYGLVGIHVEGFNKCEISNNIISYIIKNGIYIKDSNCNIVSNNTIIDNHRRGVFVTSSNNNWFINNTISRNGKEGIEFYKSKLNIISGNNISHSMPGIYIFQSKQNIISGNKISYNSYYGIRIYYNSKQNLITGNNISYNYNGILLYVSSAPNRISRNNIINNEWDGIHLSQSYGNTIDHNNFKDNRKDVTLEYLPYFSIIVPMLNRWRYNYWGRPMYHPKLIVCELGYLIDWRPAKEPYDIEI